MSTLTTATPVDKKAAKKEMKLRKKEEKRLRKQEKHLHKDHHHGHGVAGTGLGATGSPVVAPAVAPVVAPVAPVATAAAPLQNVVHEPERVIQHKPLLEKEVLTEHPVEVKHEHHIQPIIHETVHQIQPVIKTQAIAETTIIEQDKNVMLPPIVEPPTMMSGAAAMPIATERLATRELPHEHHHGRHAHRHAHHRHGRHHDHPMMMGGYNNYMWQPYGHPMMMRGLPMGGYGYHGRPMMMGGYPGMWGYDERHISHLHGPILPLGTAETVIPIAEHKRGGLLDKIPLLGRGHTTTHDGPVPIAHQDTTTSGLPGGPETTMTNKATMGQKIKGAVKEVQGTITRNPAVKEEGRMLMHGVEPATSPVAGPTNVSVQ